MEQIKQILKPGFRLAKCQNKECNKRYGTAMTYKDLSEQVCSGRCRFKYLEQQNKTLWRFRK